MWASTATSAAAPSPATTTARISSAPPIGDYCFIGCNTNLVAPVKIGDGAYTAAGSTITKDVPAQALGIARERQTNLDGWAEPKMEAYIAKKQKLEKEQNQ